MGAGGILTDKHTSLAFYDTLHDVLDMLPLGSSFGVSFGICEKHCILHECISTVFGVAFNIASVARSLTSCSSTLIDIRTNSEDDRKQELKFFAGHCLE